MIHGFHHFGLTFRKVCQHDFEGSKNAHATDRIISEVFANAVFEHAHLDQLVFLRYAAAFDEIAQCGRGITSSAHSGDRRHARITPAFNDTLLDQSI